MMSLHKFKALTFDVVGTLIDFERGMIEYIRGAVPEAAPVGDDAILDAYRHVRAKPAAGWYPDDLVRVYGDMARELKLPATAGVAEWFPNSVKQWPAFPDSAAALKRLRARFRLVAMTNARRWALAHMAHTLGEPFDDMVTVDDVRFEKPDPQFFAFARGRLSASGYLVCWIERRKGLKGFGGTKEAPITRPDYHFATLAELADAVDAEGRG